MHPCLDAYRIQSKVVAALLNRSHAPPQSHGFSFYIVKLRIAAKFTQSIYGRSSKPAVLEILKIFKILPYVSLIAV
jgi:hypothetical protein